MVSANREGIISIFGYFALWLIGTGIGRDIYCTLTPKHPLKMEEERNTKEGIERSHASELRLLLKIFMYAFLIWLSSEVGYLAFDVPSRRLCNCSWVCYQILLNMAYMVATYGYDRFTIDHSNENVVVNALDLNQLIIFGSSNLLCGLINITT